MIRLLSIVWNFDPVFFSIGSLDIRYYGLMWALAILIGAKFFDNFCKREGLPPKVSESIFIYGTLATIIGARLGHCLFYDPMEYLSKPWTIITGFRDGGMASHGAAIGLLIGLWLFSRKNKLPYIWSLDRIMIAVGIGSSLAIAGTHTAELRVTNSLGDTATVPVTVEVTAGDVNPARITLTQYLIYLPAGSSYAPLDYVSGVNGGDSKNGVTADSAVNTQVPGVYEVVFSYRSGNTESHTRQIVVVE